MTKECRSYFESMKKDFTVEFKWSVRIPILSFLCPNDVLTIRKRGCELRTDFTFEDYKNLSTIRRPSSFVLMKNEMGSLNIIKCDHKKKIHYDICEELDEEEMDLVIEDIMTKKRMNGSFKLLEAKLEETKSFFDSKKNIYEEIDGRKAQKYELKLRVKLDRNPTEKIIYVDLNEENYFDPNSKIILNTQNCDENDLQKHLEDGFHIRNKTVTTSLNEMEKEKKLKAYVWVVRNSPINSEDAVKLINSLAPANDFMGKVKEFFEHPDLLVLIRENGFPVKVQIPYNIFIDLTFSFGKFQELDHDDQYLVSMYDFLKDSRQLSRKEAQNIKVEYKTRAAFANIR